MDTNVNIAPRYLRIPEAAVYLGVSRKHLYRLVEERRIPFIRKGKMILFDRLALDKWMLDDAVQPLPAWN